MKLNATENYLIIFNIHFRTILGSWQNCTEST